ncbi:hypothetical protein LSTR_LSTR007291 [Laodelphax striatellus]|uniref:Uncharacterized protein n=1 Tax=Laodelphax striatellus TaxID=195883 RepID=A0A482XEW1_LAOST|nr:hypothetical protein LSTR_LSTR007291 [Laodelphax striatellus]
MEKWGEEGKKKEKKFEKQHMMKIDFDNDDDDVLGNFCDLPPFQTGYVWCGRILCKNKVTNTNVGETLNLGGIDVLRNGFQETKLQKMSISALGTLRILCKNKVKNMSEGEVEEKEHNDDNDHDEEEKETKKKETTNKDEILVKWKIGMAETRKKKGTMRPI